MAAIQSTTSDSPQGQAETSRRPTLTNDLSLPDIGPSSFGTTRQPIPFRQYATPIPPGVRIGYWARLYLRADMSNRTGRFRYLQRRSRETGTTHRQALSLLVRDLERASGPPPIGRIRMREWEALRETRKHLPGEFFAFMSARGHTIYYSLWWPPAMQFDGAADVMEVRSKEVQLKQEMDEPAMHSDGPADVVDVKSEEVQVKQEVDELSVWKVEGISPRTLLCEPTPPP